MASKSTTGNRSVREPLARLRNGLPSSRGTTTPRVTRAISRSFWYRRWIAAVRDEEMPEAGDWRVVRIGTQSIVLLRGEHGELRAFHNTCRHRGSILCTEESGSFRASVASSVPTTRGPTISAASLIATPRRMPTPDFDPTEAFAVRGRGRDLGRLRVRQPRRSQARPLAEAAGRASRAVRALRIRPRCGSESASSPTCTPTGSSSSRTSPNASTARRCTRALPHRDRLPRCRRLGPSSRRATARRCRRSQSEFKAGARTLTLDGTARLPPLSGLNDAERGTLYVPALLPPNLFLQRASRLHQRAHDVPDRAGERAHRLRLAVRAAPPAARGRRTSSTTSRCGTSPTARTRAIASGSSKACTRASFRHGVYVPQEFDCDRFARWVRAGLRHAARIECAYDVRVPARAQRRRNARTP